MKDKTKPNLNLPPADLSLKKQDGKDYIWDRLRKQFVRLTPEEYVRQRFIFYLIEDKNYPEGLLANEVSIELANLKRRCDTVLYDKQLTPQMIIEYKAPSIEITQETFNQILRYNMTLNVRWLIVSNGIQHYCCSIDKDGNYCFEKEIPKYEFLVK